MVTLWGKTEGLVSLAAASARRQKSKLSALEPLHTLKVVYEGRPDGGVGRLVEAELVRARMGITESLDHLEAASKLLAWIRDAFSERLPEPALFERVEEALDRFDARVDAPEDELVRAGFFMLRELGYGLDFQRCVSCGRLCPEGKPATIDPERGGLVCASCGAGAILVRAEERAALADLASDVAPRTHSEAAARILERALISHGVVREKRRPQSGA